MYVLFDARACGGVGTADAVVLDTDRDLNTLRDSAAGMGPCAIYEYDEVEGELVNERFVEDTSLPIM